MAEIAVVIAYMNLPTSGAELWHTVHSIKASLDGSPYVGKVDIIVADNEPKLSNEVLKLLSEKNLVKVVQCPERSTAKVRNAGLAATDDDTQFILFMDCHCILPYGFIDRGITTLKETEHAALHGRTLFWGANGGGFTSYCIDFSDGIMATNSNKLHHPYTPYLIPASGLGAAFFKRKPLERIGGFIDEQVEWGGEEVPVELLLWMYGYTVALDPKLYHYHYDGCGRRRHERLGASIGFWYIYNSLVGNYVLGGDEYLDKNYKYYLGVNPKVLQGLDIKAYDAGQKRRQKLLADKVMDLDGVQSIFRDCGVPVEKHV